ncbi:lysophospholipid acyltransferase family protein [Pedobacter mucosus]|uniref:lysophospholipid acyltransferase family protein n=1 Tax=Pedobacter mucosus TaxID=2895286 RepID=UPI001EE4A7D3|nr:1-acyl-sn-glycerol-3-phosphate acyltransferase [Pedobacter mucosus]UKT62882.1 1-acyl-sn-glycerol-3-phosphate acyltransferase [Pedobacter mucosus]
MLISDIEIKPNHSYLLMCNHFSFLDGILAYYLCNKSIWGKNTMQSMHIMILKKQLQKNKWLKYCGSFSVDPGKRSIMESFEHAADILSQPGNLLLFYPQGKLESSQIRKIIFEDGIKEIVPRIKGNCQLIWSSNIIEFFESTKPSIYYNLLDCATNKEFDFEKLKQRVNLHHNKAIEKNFRFTDERI